MSTEVAGRGAGSNAAIKRIDLGVNCYLMAADEGFVLIDASFPRRQDELDAELQAAGCRPGTLRLIVATHGDVDHVGNCAHLRRIYGSRIAIGRKDAEMARTGNMSLGRKDKPDAAAVFFRLIVWTVGLVNKVRGKKTQFEGFEPDILLDDQQDLSDYGLNARVVSLPGHSKGSIGILTSSGDLFCGDLLVNVTKPALHFYIDDMVQARESVGKLSNLAVRTVYPGHGKPFPLSQLRIRGVLEHGAGG
jgi:hydroxyacylglutathione hydrolase